MESELPPLKDVKLHKICPCGGGVKKLKAKKVWVLRGRAWGAVCLCMCVSLVVCSVCLSACLSLCLSVSVSL